MTLCNKENGTHEAMGLAPSLFTTSHQAPFVIVTYRWGHKQYGVVINRPGQYIIVRGLEPVRDKQTAPPYTLVLCGRAPGRFSTVRHV